MTPLEWVVIGALIAAVVGGVGALFAGDHVDAGEDAEGGE